jgi:gamma-glutamylcyclotransferase (GGCT)/AIG2-like uncharacterized protein YtfP
MEDTSKYLFVYGTLLDEKNEYGAYLKNNSTSYNEGKLQGELYDIGDYPGAINLTECDLWVHGLIFTVSDLPAVLKVLDDYEGFGEECPQPNEFVRKLLPVEADNDIINCWVYLYNLPVENFRHIKSGKYFER